MIVQIRVAQRFLLRIPKTATPRRIPTRIASHGKPGIEPPPEPKVITVELRVVTEVAVVRDVELIVEVRKVAVLEVAVTVEFTVEVIVVDT
jgi:hypothetical protein